ncbi:MAG TPA: hypothetical protein ENJ27_00070 [Candidatus Moranbacteria bacterium]|nr:hypothetical protein [Candidatus Moranbacteria bacterium]
MKNKQIVIILGVIVVLILGVFAFQKWQSKEVSMNNSTEKNIEKNSNNDKKDVQKNKSKSQNNNADDYGDPNSDVIYYYGKECPHCEKVAEFLDKNDIYNKVDFAKKEVWHNKSNGKELMSAAQKCGIDPKNVGVPFLFADGKCFIGDADVIAYFKEKAGIK